MLLPPPLRDHQSSLSWPVCLSVWAPPGGKCSGGRTSGGRWWRGFTDWCGESLRLCASVKPPEIACRLRKTCALRPSVCAHVWPNFTRGMQASARAGHYLQSEHLSECINQDGWRKRGGLLHHGRPRNNMLRARARTHTCAATSCSHEVEGSVKIKMKSFVSNIHCHIRPVAQKYLVASLVGIFHNRAAARDE